MTRDLHDLLTEAAPEPREEVDVDAVLDRGAQLVRRRTAGIVVAVVLALAGTVGIATQLFGEDPAPIIDQQPGEGDAAPEPGTYGDGAVVVAGPGGTPQVDLSVEARVTGELVATLELDGQPRGLAIATDGALGITDVGGTMRIEQDGQELASVDLRTAVAEAIGPDNVPEDLQPRQPVFSPDGTLWVPVPLAESFAPDDLTTPAPVVVVGLARDGAVTTDQATGNGASVLRTSAEGVSLVTPESDGMLFFDETTIVTTPVIGADAPGGEHVIPADPDLETSGGGPAPPPSAEERLSVASHLGRRSVQLTTDRDVDWRMLNGGISLFGPGAVAGDRTAELRTWAMPDRNGYLPPSVLTVSDADGTTAVALLPEAGELNSVAASLSIAGVLVSPDGAVHVVQQPGIGRVEVRRVLDTALRPVGLASDASDGPDASDGDQATVPGADPDLARQLAGAVGAFEAPDGWQEVEPSGGRFADAGFPTLEVAQPSGDPAAACPEDELEPCLRARRTWRLRPDDGPSPISPAEVDQLSSAIDVTSGWELVHEPDCIPGRDVDPQTEPLPHCTWEADVPGDAYALVELGRRTSAEPWQLTVTVQTDGYFQRAQESPVAIAAKRDAVADLLDLADRIGAEDWRLAFEEVRSDPPSCTDRDCLTVFRAWFGIEELSAEDLEQRLVEAGVTIDRSAERPCGRPFVGAVPPIATVGGTTDDGVCVQADLDAAGEGLAVEMVVVPPSG